MKFLCANSIATHGTPRSAASHLGLYCLPVPHKGTPGLYVLRAEVDLKRYQINYNIQVRIFKEYDLLPWLILKNKKNNNMSKTLSKKCL